MLMHPFSPLAQHSLDIASVSQDRLCAEQATAACAQECGALPGEDFAHASSGVGDVWGIHERLSQLLCLDGLGFGRTRA
jgi:hypothetical protein